MENLQSCEQFSKHLRVLDTAPHLICPIFFQKHWKESWKKLDKALGLSIRVVVLVLQSDTVLWCLVFYLFWPAPKWRGKITDCWCYLFPPSVCSANHQIRAWRSFFERQTASEKEMMRGECSLYCRPIRLRVKFFLSDQSNFLSYDINWIREERSFILAKKWTRPKF